MRFFVVSLVLASAACGKKDPAPQPTAPANPTSPAATSPAEPTAAPTPAPTAAPTPAPTAAPTATPAIVGGGADTPEKALAMFYPALRKPDAEALWALTAEEARGQLQTMLDKAKAGEMKLPEEFGVGGVDVATLTVKDLFLSIAKLNADKQKERLVADPTDARFETIEDGKRAKASYKLGPAFCELSLVKEPDGWKIAREECNEGG